MKTVELAELLGLSQQMVNRLKRAGMPCHNLEAAQHWRAKYLNPVMTKIGRIDKNPGKAL
jgi:hypothetical protein